MRTIQATPHLVPTSVLCVKQQYHTKKEAYIMTTSS